MILTNEKLLTSLHYNALLYAQYADTFLTFWHSRSKRQSAKTTMVFCGRDNFMHLVGINSKTCTAFEFYNRCLSGTVCMEDCTPSHDIENRDTRVSIFGALFDFARSKLYRIGEKDLSTLKNDFDIATGNDLGTIGYSARYNRRKIIPTTLTNNPISAYCSEVDKILAVVQHDPRTDIDTLLFEIAAGVYATLTAAP